MQKPTENELRAQVVHTANQMNVLGINQGKSGNVSSRFDGGFLITPSGISYDYMAPGQIVAVDMEGNHQGSLLPSSEWRFHLDIYKAREDAGAIVHTHSPFCTALACHGKGIPAFHYMVAVAGGKDIRCAKYATFGTQALADNILEALEDRQACLIGNHGMVCLGENLQKTLAIAHEVETLAAQYWRALQMGEPTILSDTEMSRVLEKFKDYGKQPASENPSHSK